jgi:8-oxo-dGTP pyrophosphatase MutT (NUDIX family)
VSDSSSADIPIALASTVLVLRDTSAGPEVLLVQRARALAFHGGAWVFPGGRVDPQDEVAGGELATARAAAVREAHEEARLALQLESLVTLSHWTTPKGRSRRFATWFFATALDAPHDVVVDGGEISAHRWLSPASALQLQSSGEIELPPPTFVTLSVIEEFASAQQILASFQRAEPQVYVPRQQPVSDGFVSLYRGDAAYEDGEVERPGPRHRLHMRASGWRYERPSGQR